MIFQPSYRFSEINTDKPSEPPNTSATGFLPRLNPFSPESLDINDPTSSMIRGQSAPQSPTTPQASFFTHFHPGSQHHSMRLPALLFPLFALNIAAFRVLIPRESRETWDEDRTDNVSNGGQRPV